MADNETVFPQRKDLRLNGFDYDSTGAYFVTVCVKDKKRILSNITNPVGDGAHDVPRKPKIKLTPIGAIVEKYLLSSERIPGVKIDRYVIMPDHIHAIIILDSDKYDKHKDGTSKAPSPTNKMLPRIISTFKRFCNHEIGYNIFERGYYEHIIRDKEDYETRVRYIHENPMKWALINQSTDEK